MDIKTIPRRLWITKFYSPDGSAAFFFPDENFSLTIGTGDSPDIVDKLARDKFFIARMPSPAGSAESGQTWKDSPFGILMQVKAMKAAQDKSRAKVQGTALARVRIANAITEGLEASTAEWILFPDVAMPEDVFQLPETQEKIARLKSMSAEVIALLMDGAEIMTKVIDRAKRVETIGQYFDDLAMFLGMTTGFEISRPLATLATEQNVVTRMETLLTTYASVVEKLRKSITVSGLAAEGSQLPPRARRLTSFSAKPEEPQGGDDLDQDRCSPEAQALRERLRAKLIGEGGQKRAITRLGAQYEIYLSQFRDPRAPLATLFLLGPSGVGKTELAELVAEFLLGDRTAMAKVPCGQYTHSHEVSKLIGAPPSYVGYNDRPKLAQEQIDRPGIEAEIRALQTEIHNTPSGQDTKELVEKLKRWASQLQVTQSSGGSGSKAVRTAEQARALPVFSVILFDEIDKAHEDILKLLLEVLAKGVGELGTGEHTDFSNSVIICTSNYASKDIGKLLRGGLERMGFGEPMGDHSVYKVAMEKLKELLTPEFIGRLQANTIVLSALSPEEIRQVRDLRMAELDELIRREVGDLTVTLDEAAKHFLFEESGDHPEYGVRLLQTKIKHHVIEPLSRLSNTGQLKPGDVLVGVVEAGDTHAIIRFKRVKK